LLLGENKMSFVKSHNYEQSKALRVISITVGLCKWISHEGWALCVLQEPLKV